MFLQLFQTQLKLLAEADGFDEEKEEDNELELDPFNKERLVRAHEQIRVPLEMYANRPRVAQDYSTGDTAAAPSAPLRGLRPMLVGDLQVGCRHKGRVLYGELCVEPLKMVSVQTVLVDEAGHATKLSIYNALPKQRDVQKMRILFPKGLKVAIKEPYFKIAMDGSLMIRVNNPADLVHNPPVSSFGSKKKNAWEPSLSSSSTSPSSSSSSSHEQLNQVLLDARALRSQGAQAFAAQDWKHAIQLYTNAVKSLLESLNMSTLSPSSSSSSSPASSMSSSSSSSSSSAFLEVTKELVLNISNRAEARLRLKHFEAAERDSSKALELQKNHLKSLFRKGRALHGLHLYKEAIHCFTEALQIANEEKGMSVNELTNALEASKICDKQARTGKYNLLKMWREVDEGREPICGEYLGPIEIGAARDETLGRGLLVTRDVKPGDLLIVSKAVARAQLDSSSLEGLSEPKIAKADIYHDDLALQVLDRAVSSKRFREQVYSLSPTNSKGVGKNIPMMDLFAPKQTQSGLLNLKNLEEEEALDPDSIDLECVRKVTRCSAFELAGELAATFWLLPSFMNHSCLPNASWMRVGNDTLLVRAIRHLTKGQEITISYLDNPCLPLFMRSFKQHCRGFECRCERCRFEKTVERFTKLLKLLPADDMEALEVVKSLEWAFQNIKVFEDEEKREWLRTSYAVSYIRILSLDKASLQHTFADMQPSDAILSAVQKTLGGSEMFLTAVRQVVNVEQCSPHVRSLVASMYTCLYGKQAPADLRALAALRHSMMESKMLLLGMFWEG